MKAAVVTETGVQVKDVPEPPCGPGQVKIRVRAAGMNRADLAVAAGHQHGPQGGPGTIIGIECAGEVVEVGEGVPAHITRGMRVASGGAGSYAEYAVADWGRVVPVPEANMGWEKAATLPVALATMHDALVTNGGLTPGKTVLIQGASSGVGLMAMQIAKLMGAKLVMGSSTTAEKRARLPEFGCDLAIDTTDAAWPDKVLEATGGKGVDIIIDQVSGTVANGNLKCCAILGRIVNVGRLGGQKGEFDFDLHAARRISYIGVTFRTRNAAEVREIYRRMQQDLWGAVQAGRLGLPISKVFPLAEAPEALAHMKANRHFGKLVLAC